MFLRLGGCCSQSSPNVRSMRCCVGGYSADPGRVHLSGCNSGFWVGRAVSNVIWANSFFAEGRTSPITGSFYGGADFNSKAALWLQLVLLFPRVVQFVCHHRELGALVAFARDASH